jgi:hypothetical protein
LSTCQAKLRAAVAWLKDCPPWQKLAAAEDALDKALEALDEIESRIAALERGDHGEGQGG